VLVRSGRTSIPPLRRALAAAGVPVEVASDDLPLVRDPAVLPLLDGLRAVVNLDNDDPDSPDFLDPGRIEALLLSPLGGLDASDLRALVRRLRLREKEQPDVSARRTSRELLRLAVVEPGFLDEMEGPDVERTRALASLLRQGAQLLPADTLAERGVRGAAVRLLTAHRSKGLEWDLVVVAHVQQEGWPDLRRRATLLGADRVGVDGSGRPDLVPPVTARALLMEERRLFYVACTRARRRLVVSAVRSPDDDGEQPSRFLEELGVTIEHQDGRPPRPLSLGGLVAELRRTASDPDASSPLREAAARRLAALAAEEVDGRQLVPSADPSAWWGTRSATRSVQPIRDPERPVPISASMLESILVCPAQWFFEREAGGVSAVHQSANLGQVLHALAERVAGGELPAEVEPLMTEVEAIWDRLAFRTPWSRQRELARIRKAVARFVRWHLDNPREVLGAEQRFQSVVEVDDRPVTLTGFAEWSSSTSRARGPHPPVRPSRPTSSSPSTSTPSTPAPSTRRPGARSPPVAPSWCSSASTTTRRAPGCRASRPTRTTVPSVPSCAPGSPAPPTWCAPRPSRPRPDPTAATAPSSPSARPAARGA
jgi:ATP-dependent exoDNAse (exonuclease V) beta subunit